MGSLAAPIRGRRRRVLWEADATTCSNGPVQSRGQAEIAALPMIAQHKAVLLAAKPQLVPGI